MMKIDVDEWIEKEYIQHYIATTKYTSGCTVEETNTIIDTYKRTKEITLGLIRLFLRFTTADKVIFKDRDVLDTFNKYGNGNLYSSEYSWIEMVNIHTLKPETNNTTLLISDGLNEVEIHIPTIKSLPLNHKYKIKWDSKDTNTLIGDVVVCRTSKPSIFEPKQLDYKTYSTGYNLVNNDILIMNYRYMAEKRKEESASKESSCCLVQ